MFDFLCLSGHLTLYKNGLKVQDEESVALPDRKLRSKHFIGKAVSGGGFWKGEISYVRFWDRYSVTSEQAKQVTQDRWFQSHT